MVAENADCNADKNERLMLTESFHRFSRVMEDFSDFDRFRVSLGRALEQDQHFDKILLSAGDDEVMAESSKAETVFKMGNVVLPLKDAAAGSFIRVTGRRDARPFGAEDLHLMGAIASFVSSLYGQSKNQRHNALRLRALQFLIDELPVGVLCLGADDAFLAGNRKAWQQLGVDCAADLHVDASILRHLSNATQGCNEAHLEVQGRLLFAVKRQLTDEGAGPVCAYVFYDMDARRDKLADALDREYFRTLCTNGRMSVSLLQDTSKPGALFAAARQCFEHWNIDEDFIQPLDAYTVACLFVHSTPVRVRRLLEQFAKAGNFQGLRVSVLEAREAEGQSPSKTTLDRAKELLQPYSKALLPHLLVFDRYEPVVETLEVMLEDICRMEALHEFEEFMPRLETFSYEGLIADLDSMDLHQFEWLKEALKAYPAMNSLFLSTKARSMMETAGWPLETKDILIQKPFNAHELINTIRDQLNLA